MHVWGCCLPGTKTCPCRWRLCRALEPSQAKDCLTFCYERACRSPLGGKSTGRSDNGGATWAACRTGTRQDGLLWGFSGASLALHEARPCVGRRGVTYRTCNVECISTDALGTQRSAGSCEIRRSRLSEQSAPITEKTYRVHPSLSQNALSRVKPQATIALSASGWHEPPRFHEIIFKGSFVANIESDLPSVTGWCHCCGLGAPARSFFQHDVS